MDSFLAQILVNRDRFQAGLGGLGSRLLIWCFMDRDSVR